MTYSVSGLPSGLSYDELSHEVSGSPTRAGQYTVTYQAEDGDGDSCTETFTITITRPPPPPPPPRNRPPDITGGPTSASYQENRTTSVATYTATDPDGDTISWSLPNTSHETDRGDFSITSSGVLGFLNTPDYENPVDSNRNNVYRVTVRASDGNGGSDDRNVTITVTNVEEPGGVGLTAPSVQVGGVITAALFDLDGSVTNETWQWQRSPDGAANWSDIPGATGNTYTVTDDDLGKWLRATVAYTDGHGPGKSAESGTVYIPPPGPTGLRANGHLVGGEVTLRWEPVSGAASYEVQYALDIFPAIGPLLWMTPDDYDISITDPTIGGKTVKEATLGSLTAGRLYQVRVRATETGGVSRWSDFVVVHPTAAPYTDGMDTEVATIGLFVYQPNGVFDYVICNPPKTYWEVTGALIFQTLPSQDYVDYIDTVVKDWDNFVKWDVGGGTNIIRTVDRGAITDCRNPAAWQPDPTELTPPSWPDYICGRPRHGPNVYTGAPPRLCAETGPFRRRGAGAT